MLSHEEQRAFDGFDGSSGLEGEGEGLGGMDDEDEVKVPHLAPPAELHASPARGLGRRAFDLDDGDGLEGFANSPAGEGEGEERGDVEAVREEERKGSLLGGMDVEEGSGEGSGNTSGEDDEGVVMKGVGEKAKGDLHKFWK